MKKLLWIGDAACDSGFAKVTHQVLEVLREHYEIFVVGINYRGDHHTYPYKMYPAHVLGCQDFLGYDRISEIVPQIEPDIVFILNDPWNFPGYIAALKRIGSTAPIIGMVAIDGKNCLGDLLNDLDHTIFWTEFGQREAKLGGFSGPSSVVPLGVDLDVYFPRPQARREVLNDSFDDAFIVGNANRNQPRKRLDLTVQYFAEWVREFGVDDAYLFLHIGPTGEVGYNCQQLLHYYGIKKRLIRSTPGVWHGIPEKELADIYNCYDVQVSTTQGEGWGLTTMEGMACGVPQILPGWSALGEWASAAIQIPCSNTIATVGAANAIGGIPDKHSFIEALHRVYTNRSYRQALTIDGLALVRDPRYRWKTIGNQVLTELQTLTGSGQEDTCLA
jgi:D-inositol-3-phosphate glycosyltransferase